jgi:hypothetical protein
VTLALEPDAEQQHGGVGGDGIALRVPEHARRGLGLAPDPVQAAEEEP